LLAAQPDIHPLLLASIQRTLDNQRETPTEGILLTDDRAPVEWLTDRMIIEHIAGGGELDEDPLPTAP